MGARARRGAESRAAGEEEQGGTGAGHGANRSARARLSRPRCGPGTKPAPRRTPGAGPGPGRGGASLPLGPGCPPYLLRRLCHGAPGALGALLPPARPGPAREAAGAAGPARPARYLRGGSATLRGRAARGSAGSQPARPPAPGPAPPAPGLSHLQPSSPSAASAPRPFLTLFFPDFCSPLLRRHTPSLAFSLRFSLLSFPLFLPLPSLSLTHSFLSPPNPPFSPPLLPAPVSAVHSNPLSHTEAAVWDCPTEKQIKTQQQQPKEPNQPLEIFP